MSTSSWGAGKDPAERTVPSVDPANLNQVILAEGKINEFTNQSTNKTV